MRGFYRMDYQGTDGSGAGALAFVDGKIAGLDTGGGIYKGTYTEAGGNLTGSVQMSFPDGGHLVTGFAVPKGTPAQTIPFTIQPGATQIKLQTPTGPVSLQLTKVSEL